MSRDLYLDEEAQRIEDIARGEGLAAARKALDVFLDRVKRLDQHELATALDFNAKLVTEVDKRLPLLLGGMKRP